MEAAHTHRLPSCTARRSKGVGGGFGCGRREEGRLGQAYARVDELDERVADYCNHLYLNGEDSMSGDNMKSTLGRYYALHQRGELLSFRRCHRHLRAWRNVTPDSRPKSEV